MYTFVNVGTVEERKWWLKVTLEEFLNDEDKFEDILNYYHKKYLKQDGIIYVNQYDGCNSFMGDDAIEVVQALWFPEEGDVLLDKDGEVVHLQKEKV